MAELSPDTSARLGRLLPRLASDAPGEVMATVAVIRRTLDRADMDLHDLAARLTGEPCLLQPKAPKRRQHAQADGAELLEIAQWLHTRRRHRLSHQQAEFVATAARLLAARRALTPKQEQWLLDLHAKQGGFNG